jgi:DNA polymerase-4
LVGVADTKALVYLLAESVAHRLRELGLEATGIGVSVRSAGLSWYSRQVRLRTPTAITREVAHSAWQLVEANEPLDGSHPLRSLGVRAFELVSASAPRQLSLFSDEEARARALRLDMAIDALRDRFGNRSVRRLTSISDETMAGLDIKGDNVVHPVGFFQSEGQGA